MTPTDALRSLSRQLASHGQDCTLQRLSVGTPQTVLAQVAIRALVRPVGPAVDLVNTMAQSDVLVIFTPQEIVAAGWTSGAQGVADPRVPVKGNRLVMADRMRAIDAVRPFYMANVLVRIEVVARG